MEDDASQRGIAGALFADDVASGACKSRKYEVAVGPPPNDNWFTIAEFVEAVKGA